MSYYFYYETFGKYLQDENIIISMDNMPLEVMWKLDPQDKDYVNAYRSNAGMKQGWQSGLELIGTAMQRNILQRLWRFSLVFLAKRGTYSFTKIKQNLKTLLPQTISSISNTYWQTLNERQYRDLTTGKSFVMPTETIIPPTPPPTDEGIDIPPAPPEQPTSSLPFLPQLDISKYILPISIAIAGVILILAITKKKK